MEGWAGLKQEGEAGQGREGHRVPVNGWAGHAGARCAGRGEVAVRRSGSSRNLARPGRHAGGEARWDRDRKFPGLASVLALG